MNQILDFGNDDKNDDINIVDETNLQGPFSNEKSFMQDSEKSIVREEKNQYSNTYNQIPNKENSKNIMKIFAIFLVVLAVVILGLVGYIFVKKHSKSNVKDKSSKPEILVVDNQGQLVITAKHDKVLEKLIYTWDENPDMKIAGGGEKTITKNIDVPFGTHNLKIKVVDIEGNESEFEGKYTRQEGEDIEKPIITLEITEDKKLKILVKENMELKTVNYFWDKNQPQEVMAAVGKKEYEFYQEIPVGKHKFTIYAEDKSGNKITEEKEFVGKKKPELKKIIKTEDFKKIIVEVAHEDGIKKITCVQNGKPFSKEFEGDGIRESVRFEIPLVSGNNVFEFKIISTSGEILEFARQTKGPEAQTPTPLETNTRNN